MRLKRNHWTTLIGKALNCRSSVFDQITVHFCQTINKKTISKSKRAGQHDVKCWQNQTCSSKKMKIKYIKPYAEGGRGFSPSVPAENVQLFRYSANITPRVTHFQELLCRMIQRAVTGAGAD